MIGPLIVPKLAARHQWAGGMVTLGDPTATPRFKLTQIDGLGSLGEREDNRDPRYAQVGEIPRRSVRRGKVVTYTGRILAADLTTLRTAEAMLLAAFADTTERRMDILTPMSPTQPAMFFMAGAQACDISDAVGLGDTAGGAVTEYERGFVIALRMSDPRVYQATPTVITTGPRAATEGLTLPQTLPVTVPAGTVIVGAANAANPGSAASPPLIDLPGPLNGPWVSNASLGRMVNMPGLVVPAGSWVRVDFAQRAVLIEAQTDVTGQAVDFATSDWWYPDVPGLQAGAWAAGAWADGANLVRAGDAQGRTPTVTVTFNAANWG